MMQLFKNIINKILKKNIIKDKSSESIDDPEEVYWYTTRKLLTQEEIFKLEDEFAFNENLRFLYDTYRQVLSQIAGLQEERHKLKNNESSISNIQVSMENGEILNFINYNLTDKKYHLTMIYGLIYTIDMSIRERNKVLNRLTEEIQDLLRIEEQKSG